MRRLLYPCLVVACNATNAADDAGDDASFTDARPDVFVPDAYVDPDACASCQPLTAFCATDASAALPCPPDLGSPTFDTWARERLARQNTASVPVCVQNTACPETLMVLFGETDCDTQYVFDALTKKLVGISRECNGMASCIAADGCLQLRCISDGGVPGVTYVASPATCPPMPDGGISDAGSD